MEKMKCTWVACTEWSDIPHGTWLVKIGNDRKPYHVAVVSNSTVIIVGGQFHFDMGNPVAYTAFEEYNG